MNIRVAHELDQIIRLHEAIFAAPFPREKYARRVASGDRLLHIILEENGEAAGYAVIVANGHNYHLWIGGILPALQGCGLMAQFLVWLENQGLANNFKTITLNTDNHKNHLLRLALKHGFDIVGTEKGSYGDGTRIRLFKKIRAPLNLRIALTGACNYRCIFCHGEGVPRETGMAMAPATLEKILVQAAKLNLQSLVFTGGEPLLNPDTLLHGLKLCRTMGRPPIVKVVTNGAFLESGICRNLAAYPRIKVNLSLHGPNPGLCARITGSEESFQSGLRAIRLLKEHDISCRINMVPMAGINDSPEILAGMLKVALVNTIEEISFLELYVEPCHATALQGMPHAEMEKSICRVAAESGALRCIERSDRKIVWQLDADTRQMRINLFRLSCNLGCKRCAQIKDETIGADGLLYPCFHSHEAAGDATRDLEGTLEAGKVFVGRMAHASRGVESA